MSGAGRPERDPGLQPERTRLAWRRTTLACTVVAVLAVKEALRGSPSLVSYLICALSLIVWLAFLAAAHRRVRALSVATGGLLDAWLAVAAVLCTVALALCGAVVVI